MRNHHLEKASSGLSRNSSEVSEASASGRLVSNSIAVVIALLASALVLLVPTNQTKADYIAVSPGTITYNDRICNIADPSNHSTSETAYAISSVAELWEITDCVSTSATIYFELSSDLDVSGEASAPTNSPIGYKDSGTQYSFTGVLDGRGHQISGLAMSRSDRVGLFFELEDATVSNLVLSGSFIRSSPDSSWAEGAAALSVLASGTVDVISVSNLADVSGRTNVGGLIGDVDGTVNLSFSNNSGEISGSGENVGGLLGYASKSHLVSSFNTGPVNGTGAGGDIGGLVGDGGRGSSFISSYNTATVSALSDDVGGLVGLVRSTTISASYNTGYISGDGWVGGLVGDGGDAVEINSSYNVGRVSGSDSVGGLLGGAYVSSNVLFSFNSGEVSGVSDIGGLVGEAGDELTVRASYNTGQVTGTGSDVGGVVGWAGDTVSMTATYNTATVSGTSDVGGLIGDAADYATILSSYNTGSVTGTGPDIGGLVGYVRYGVIISASHNSGAVSGVDYLGGLVGDAGEDAEVFASYNTGSITGTGSLVGGLVGFLEDGDIQVSSSYNTGSVSGDGDTGGLVGYGGDKAEVFSSYNSGSVTSTGTDNGGLIGGVNVTLSIVASHNTGPVSGGGDTGGLVGDGGDNASIVSSYNTGSVTGTSTDIGGLVGYAATSVIISASHNIASVSGDGDTGGLVGDGSDNASIVSSYNTGSVTSTENDTGGLIGNVDTRLIISASYNTGPVTGVGDTGGLAGDGGDDAEIFTSYNTGAVTGTLSDTGGLVGKIHFTISVSVAFNSATVSGAYDVGGLIGDGGNNAIVASSYNTGKVSGTGSDFGGLIGFVDGDTVVSSSYNTGAVSGPSRADGLIGSISGTVTTASAQTLVPSSYAASSTVADMKLASTFLGFDFSNVWGFGLCNQNQGFPMLRTFAALETYYTFGCGLNSAPPSVPIPSPIPSYSGPMFDSKQTVVAGQEVSFSGQKLGTVTRAFAGTTSLEIIAAQAGRLVLATPNTLSSGVYDLNVISEHGVLSFNQGLSVTEPSSDIVAPMAERKLTVGSFKGFIAIYSRGYDGAKLSARVAGKWLVVDALDESWKQNDYSRTVRYTGAGYDIKVHLYINGEFIRTEDLTTK